MRDHVLQEAVAPALTEQIRRGDQHARRRDAHTFVGHENVDPLPLERLPPHPFRTLEGLDGRAHLRRGKQLEERRQVGGTGKARTDHPERVPRLEADVQPERQSAQRMQSAWVAIRRALAGGKIWLTYTR